MAEAGGYAWPTTPPLSRHSVGSTAWEKKPPKGGFFVFMPGTRMTDRLATAVYVDGYNLYYGRIRGTGFKWLDLPRLFDGVLANQGPESVLVSLRYFSAPAMGRFATHGEASVLAQQDYHRALQHVHAKRFSLTLGTHSIDRSGTKLPRYVQGRPYDRKDRVKVWKLEEKQTDVNLALRMYRDARSARFRQLVVCSNDSDAAPALAAIREDFPGIVLGVVIPSRPPDACGRRPASSVLSARADWTRHYLRDEELAAAQLPERVHTGRKPIRRPEHW